MRNRVFLIVTLVLSIAGLVACTGQNENVSGLENGTSVALESPAIESGIRLSENLNKAGGGGTPTIGELHNQVLAATVEKAGDYSYDAFVTTLTNAVNLVFAEHGMAPIAYETVFDCGCGLQNYSTAEYDFFEQDPAVVGDFSAIVADFVSTELLTSDEGDWLLGMHNAVINAGEYVPALNAVIAYGGENGFPYPDSALGQGFDVYINSMEYWEANKGIWNFIKRVHVYSADISGALVGAGIAGETTTIGGQAIVLVTAAGASLAAEFPWDGPFGGG